MNFNRTTMRRATVIVASTAASLLALSGIARADDVQMVNGTSNAISVAEDGDGTFTVQLVRETNTTGSSGDPVAGCNADPDNPVTITFKAAQTATGAVDTWATVSPTSVEVTDCTTPETITVSVDGSPASATKTAQTKIWGTAAGGRTETVVEVKGKTTTEVVLHPEYDNDFIVVNVPMLASTPAPDADGDGIADASDNCPNASNPGQENRDAPLDSLGDACDDNSYAPVVGTQAIDANGYEGGTLSASGSFTDADGNDTLTITKESGAGTVTPNLDSAGDPDGTWSWSHGEGDDAFGIVTVKASDGQHTDATQTFNWTAANVAPAIGTINLTRATDTSSGASRPCTVDLSAAFADPGSDQWSASIAWGDGTTTSPAAITNKVVSGQKTYAVAGTYTVGVTVTDDDHGATFQGQPVNGQDTDSVPNGFKAWNTPSAIMEPINTSGTRSGFKLGSTVPVKITVTGCDGNPVNNLTPTVNLTQGDPVADVPVNESTVSEVATNGKLMRWSTDKYIYNISTKLSQHTGGALSGTYTVSVSDASFGRSVNAVFDVRK